MAEITKADMVYRDEHGEEWINAEAIADLWNKRAKEEYGKEGRYARWSARNRAISSKDLRALKTVKGILYNKSDAEKIRLSPRSGARKDVTNRNKTRGFRKGTSF